MPKIIGQQEQQRALKEILATLKDVSAINSFLCMQNSSGKYTITFIGENNTKHSCMLFDVEKDDIDVLALNSKDCLRKKIHALAEEYRIALDPDEEHILSDAFEPLPMQEVLPSPSESELQ